MRGASWKDKDRLLTSLSQLEEGRFIVETQFLLRGQ